MTDPGGDRPPPASGAKTFNRWLADGVPTFVAGLLVANFGQRVVRAARLAARPRRTEYGGRRPSRTAR